MRHLRLGWFAAAGGVALLIAALMPRARDGAGLAAETPRPRIEREGLSIELDARVEKPGWEGADPRARVSFVIANGRGEPVSGLKPRAWVASRKEDGPAGDEQCRKTVGWFSAGLLSARPAADLNAWLLLVLNDDGTIGVVDPQLAFGRTKLANLLTLGGLPADWAHAPSVERVAVTIPGAGRVSLVDTARLRIAGNVAVGARPTRIVMAPDGRTAWVGNDGDGTVSVVDVERARVLETLPTGDGHQIITFDDRGSAWVATAESPRLAVYDARSRETLTTVEVGAGISSVAWSSAAGALFVVNERNDELVVVDARSRSIRERMKLSAGTRSIDFDPSGRFGFAPDPQAGTVAIVDASRPSRMRTIEGVGAVDAVVFTSAFAYLRDGRSERVRMVDLAGLEKETPPAVVQIPVGQGAPEPAGGTGPRLGSPGIPSPDGGGVILAHAEEKTLFFYQQGMMAPIGSYRNHSRSPRALLALDRRLEEVDPGVYTAAASLTSDGPFDVAIQLDSPRVVGCLGWTPAATRDADAPMDARVTLTANGEELRSGTAGTIRFRLEGEALANVKASDVSVLLVREPGNWHLRAVPRRERGGTFAVDLVPPSPGRYRLVVGVERLGLGLGSIRPVAVGVTEPGVAKTAAALDPKGARR